MRSFTCRLYSGIDGVKDFDPNAVCAVRRENGFDWPHDSIAQHEISHNFNAGEGGTWCWEHPECIMNYCWAKLGTDIWCENHWCVVYGNVNGVWEDCLI
jgi:hypothetical protein